MTDRGTVDPTRQGGEGGGGPKVNVFPAEPMTVDDALAFAERSAWRTVLAPSHQALRALADEVQRLRCELEYWVNEYRLSSTHHRITMKCLAISRTQLDVAIACQQGDWQSCGKYPWSACCAARLRAQGKTTQELVQTQSEAEDDGA